jgi:hypothetical protein
LIINYLHEISQFIFYTFFSKNRLPEAAPPYHFGTSAQPFSGIFFGKQTVAGIAAAAPTPVKPRRAIRHPPENPPQALTFAAHSCPNLIILKVNHRT